MKVTIRVILNPEHPNDNLVEGEIEASQFNVLLGQIDALAARFNTVFPDTKEKVIVKTNESSAEVAMPHASVGRLLFSEVQQIFSMFRTDL